MNTINNVTDYNRYNVQFNGIRNLYRTGMFARGTKPVSPYLITGLLAQTSVDVVEIARNSNPKRMYFFRSLAQKYNRDNFYRLPEARESQDVISRIYELVTNPEEMHNAFVLQFDGSMEDLERIFKAAGGDKKRLNFVCKINSEILKEYSNVCKNLIPELLISPNSNEYIKNYKNYKSYLKLYRNDGDIVKNLDKMLADGTYEHKKYDTLLKNRKHIYGFAFQDSEVFNSRVYAEDFTEERGKVLDALRSNFDISINIGDTGDDRSLLEIYESTTKENYNLRRKIIKLCHNRYIVPASSNAKNQNLAELSGLFTRIEQDKYAKKFVQKLAKKSEIKIKAGDINKILDNIPSVKLSIFNDNAIRLILQAENEEERLILLQNELENPFFETLNFSKRRARAEKYGYLKSQSFIYKMVQRIINRYNIQRYRHISLTIPQNTLKDPHETTLNASVLSQKITEDIRPEIKEIVSEENPEIKETAKKKLDIKKRREETKNKTCEYVSSRLGEKTWLQQRNKFGMNATKMRLGMLPEIFASIADTRKADRAVGKYRINSSNKDVLELYLLINGNNKKFVNYLLKKRNVDDTRMFEVKDIIVMVKKAEEKIQSDKKSNPEYRARDARKYYNHLYESKIEQYGKIKRPRKLSTRA